MSAPERLVLLPGLGATARLFEPQRAALPQIEVPPWIEPHPRETLPSYAARVAATIRADEPLYLGGVSFGGMLASEMARLLPCRGVFLIASCLSASAVARWARVSGPLAARLPSGAFRPPVSLAGLARCVLPLSRAQAAFLLSMLHDVPRGFIQWGIRAILGWTGSDSLKVPVWHIHGARDPVIPLAAVRPTAVVPRGTHVINVTHAAEVNAFLLRHLGSGFPARPPSEHDVRRR